MMITFRRHYGWFSEVYSEGYGSTGEAMTGFALKDYKFAVLRRERTAF